MRNKSYNKDKDDKRSKFVKGKKNHMNKRDAQLDSTGRDNDPNFYFTSKELAEQTAQLSFQNMVGLGDIRGFKVPSICRVLMNPCPGVTFGVSNFKGSPDLGKVGYAATINSDKHGINMMSSKIYTMLSTFTGRTSQYAPQDVAMMLLAISSVSELSEHIRRMFGIALTYNPRNRNLPLGLLRTMGLDVTDFLANIPRYRMKFNVLMTRINQIPLLDNIAYIRKSREIYQRVYMDSPSPMAQIFYYAPYSVWMIDEDSSNTGTHLAEILLNDNVITMEDLLTRLERMITKVIESSTLNLIYADLLNMANKVKVPVWQFDYLAENYIVMPEFNRNACLQFHHIRIMGEPVHYDTDPTPNEWAYKKRWRVSRTDATLTGAEYPITWGNYVVSDPNTNNVIYNPAFTDNSLNMTLVDMDNGDPSLEDRIEALRLSAVHSGCKIYCGELLTAVPSDYLAVLPTLPDHYCVLMELYYNVDYTSENPAKETLRSSVSVSQNTNFLWSLGFFDRSPLFYLLNSGSTGEIRLIWGDLDFYTVITYEYVQRVNEIMYTGLFEFRV